MKRRGIEKYTHALSVDLILEHLDHKFFEYDSRDMRKFTSEDDLFDRLDMADEPKPILLKFYEDWCAACKQLKPVRVFLSYLLHPIADFDLHNRLLLEPPLCSRNRWISSRWNVARMKIPSSFANGIKSLAFLLSSCSPAR